MERLYNIYGEEFESYVQYSSANSFWNTLSGSLDTLIANENVVKMTHGDVVDIEEPADLHKLLKKVVGQKATANVEEENVVHHKQEDKLRAVQ